MKIDLLVEIRRDAESQPDPVRLPAIERCLARGHEAPGEGSTFDACLLAPIGLTPIDAPLAALALAGEGEDPGPHYWLRAMPIALQATMTHVVGGCLPEDDLDESEARTRTDLLAPLLREDGFELVVKHPQRWYIRCASPQRISTSPPPQAMTVLDESLLPSGPDGAAWQRRMTEAQMVLHAADLDPARELAGRLPANGLWVWGGGRCDGVPSIPWTHVYSDDVAALGIGRLGGAVIAALPQSAPELLDSLNDSVDARVLVAMPSLHPNRLPAIDASWVAPLADATASGVVAALSLNLLHAGRPHARLVTRAALRRWWRRPRPLAQHA